MLGLKLLPATVSLLLLTNAFSRSFFLTSFACALKPKDYSYWVLFGFGAGFLLDFKRFRRVFWTMSFLLLLLGLLIVEACCRRRRRREEKAVLLLFQLHGLLG